MKILIGIPSYNNNLQHLNPYLDNLVIPEGVDVQVLVIQQTNIVSARNKFMEIAYQNDFDILWMIDDDNPPTDYNILEYVINSDYNVITGLVRGSIDNDSYCIYKRGDNLAVSYANIEGDTVVDMCGSGCIFLKKECIKTLYEKYFHNPFEWKLNYFEYIDGKPKEILPGRKSQTGALLTKFISEDLMFSHRCTENGFAILATNRIKCIHYLKDGKVLYPFN